MRFTMTRLSLDQNQCRALYQASFVGLKLLIQVEDVNYPNGRGDVILLVEYVLTDERADRHDAGRKSIFHAASGYQL